MTIKNGIAAQMSTYALDARHVEYLLPHQIRVWGPLVDRFIVAIDTYQSRSGRYRVDNFDENLRKLRQICADAAKTYPGLQVYDVDYSDAARREVARYFFNRDTIPIKAWDGGPFYSYFYGMYVADAQYIMHFDSDMFFGGGSKTWIQESIACMERWPDVLVTSPFPGPPRADGAILGHRDLESLAHLGDAYPKLSYRHVHVSTRDFLIDMNRMKSRLGALPLIPPTAKQRLKGVLLANAPEVREAETVLSITLKNSGLSRIGFLGESPGMWSLHPPYRSEEFYRRLPEFVRAVESGDVPEGQRGHYDLNDSMIDWSQARAANTWRHRYMRMLRQRLFEA
jgi:hypothetical protein